MTPRGASILAAVLACVQAMPAAAQDQAEIIFGGDVFDVTGAGVLDLGILDDALMPFRRAFDQGRERLGVELTIDAAGTVQDCRFDANAKLAPAGKALCAQALRVGRFQPYPVLARLHKRNLPAEHSQPHRPADQGRGDLPSLNRLSVRTAARDLWQLHDPARD